MLNRLSVLRCKEKAPARRPRPSEPVVGLADDTPIAFLSRRDARDLAAAASSALQVLTDKRDSYRSCQHKGERYCEH